MKSKLPENVNPVSYGESIKLTFVDQSVDNLDFIAEKRVIFGEKIVNEIIVGKWIGETYHLRYEGIEYDSSLGMMKSGEKHTVERKLIHRDGQDVLIYVKGSRRPSEDWQERMRAVYSVWSMARMFIQDPFGTYDFEKSAQEEAKKNN